MNTFWDPIRKKTIINTKEEIVRRFIISYLINNFNYNKSLFRVEKKIITYNKNINYRPDIVVYDKYGKVFLIVECKANDVKINDEVIYQIQRYNYNLHSSYLIITNGNVLYCWHLENSNYVISNIPYFKY